MSSEFSESELFVLGALASAAGDETHYFYSHASDLFGMLGLWREPSATPANTNTVDYVPDDIIWGKAETPDNASILSKTEYETLRSKLQRRMAEADAWLDARGGTEPESVSRLRKAVQGYGSMSWVAHGFARSTPDRIYGLRMSGDVAVVGRVQPLPSGFVRLVLSQVCADCAMPLGWLMAMPEVLRRLPPTAFADVVPHIETEVCVVGHDKIGDIATSLSRLINPGCESKAYQLGMLLWAVRMLCDKCFSDSDDADSSRSHEATEAQESDEQAVEDPSRLDGLPELLQEMCGLVDHVLAVRDEQALAAANEALQQKREGVEVIQSLTSQAREIANEYGMPQVETLLGEVCERLANHANGLGANLYFRAQQRDNSPFWFETYSMIGNALCVAYGDLLLRERHSPDPIPRAGTKAELLRQPAQIRNYLQAAVGMLRRDALSQHNNAVATTLLSVVLEPVVKQAVEFYIPSTRSLKVADLLYDLLDSAKRHESPDRQEMETIARIGIALHHGFRNEAVHSVTQLAGDWESAQFIAFGLLSMLNTLDRARGRNG